MAGTISCDLQIRDNPHVPAVCCLCPHKNTSHPDSVWTKPWYQGQKAWNPMQARLDEDFWTRARQKHEKGARSGRILNVFEDCGSTKCGAIRYQRGQKTFCPRHHDIEPHISLISVTIQMALNCYKSLAKISWLKAKKQLQFPWRFGNIK